MLGNLPVFIYRIFNYDSGMDLCLSSMESSYHSAATGLRNEYRLHSGFTGSLDYSTGCILPCDPFFGAKPLNIPFLLWGENGNYLCAFFRIHWVMRSIASSLNVSSIVPYSPIAPVSQVWNKWFRFFSS